MLLVLCWGCCCLPLYIRDDFTVDLSFISIFASVLLLGPIGAIVVCTITYPLIVIPSPDGKSHSHIFNTAFSKTLFNIACRNLSIGAGGALFRLFGGVAGDIALPGVLLPAFGFILMAMLVNIFGVMFYFVFAQHARVFPTVFTMFFGLAPSIAGTASIAYFLAWLLQRESGI